MIHGIKSDLADALFDVGAVQFGAFRLKLHEKQPDAPLSPIYLNLRTPDNKDGTLTPEILQQIAEVVMMRAVLIDFDLVAGIPNAGTPIAEALVHHLTTDYINSPARLLHLGKVDQESGRRIVGVQEEIEEGEGRRVLLVDDLITQADTKFEAIAALEEDNFEVAALVVLVDREQGGSEQIMATGHLFISVFTLSDLLDYYVAEGRVDQAKADEVKQYVAASHA